ncbi:MAG TPA: CBS domain-containing protein [Solirubrobacterales bacterium]|nr:CBS domain-containing protein [Solirubrobacterales bacterium]
MAVAVPPKAPEVLHLSLILGGALRDADGTKLGRVDDLIVRLGGAGYPPITGFLVTIAGRRSYVPSERVARVAPGAATLTKAKLDLRPFARRDDEVLLRHDVLDHQLINVEGARLVRANEIELASLDGWWRVVGVDTGARGGFRRLLPRALAGRIATGDFVDWASLEPFSGEVPAIGMRVLHPKLAKLHPAQIADLVEAASHDEGQEIIEAVAADAELEADVFEELDVRHQVEFVAERSDEQVAALLSLMAPDDAADLVADLPEERREAVTERLTPSQRRKVRALLGYDPAEAGGLMSPDFVSVYRHATVAEALDRVRRSALPDEDLATVWVMDAKHRFAGSLLLPALLRADPEATVLDLGLGDVPHLHPEADFEEIARLMADYNLIAAPVLDPEERMIGVVTVDDVLEVLLPKGWRRRFGLLGED